MRRDFPGRRHYGQWSGRRAFRRFDPLSLCSIEIATQLLSSLSDLVKRSIFRIVAGEIALHPVHHGAEELGLDSWGFLNGGFHRAAARMFGGDDQRDPVDLIDEESW